MNSNRLCLIGTSISLTSLLLYSQIPSFGQSDVLETWKELLQEGDKVFYKECKDVGFGKSGCDEIKNGLLKDIANDSSSGNYNTNANVTASQNGYLNYTSENKGFNVEYPADWHSDGFGTFTKGSREFKVVIFTAPEIADANTETFGKAMMENLKDDGLKMDKVNLNFSIGGDSAVKFDYLKSGKVFQVAAWIHEGKGFTLTYSSYKNNFNNETEIISHFFGSFKFLNSS